MTLLDKPPKTQPKRETPSLTSFEETYKTAYSHGLEAIYSLETVDLKTVRKIADTEASDTRFAEESISESMVEAEEIPSQLEFSFGYDFQTWVDPYFLQEPLRMLGLSSQAEAALAEHGVKTIADLLGHNLKDFVFMKGMGQGHIDEVNKKLRKFLANRSVKRTGRIDFRSILLGITLGLDLKKISILLKKYDLMDEIPLTHPEKMEIKLAEGDKERKTREELSAALKHESIEKRFDVQFSKIARSLIAPWMRTRGGIANEEEILERVENLSIKPSLNGRYLAFFSEVFCEGGFPFAPFLPKCAAHVYCSEDHLRLSFQDILEKALSFFYKPSIVYPFEELCRLVENECVKEWKHFPEGFIPSCLQQSALFTLYCSPDDILLICKS